MAYDERLAERMRTLLQGTHGLTEKKMFGGLGFLVDGRLAAAAHNGGDLLVRCSTQNWQGFLDEPGARPMLRKETPVSGWVLVDAAHLDDNTLESWVERGRAFAASQPPK